MLMVVFLCTPGGVEYSYINPLKPSLPNTFCQVPPRPRTNRLGVEACLLGLAVSSSLQMRGQNHRLWAATG